MKLHHTTLGEISKNNKGTYGIGAPAVNFDKHLPTYLRITDINDDGTINKSGLKSINDDNSSKYYLKSGDIVFARTGNSTGKNYYYDSRDGSLVYAGFLIRFHINESELVFPKFIKYFAQSNVYWGWVNGFNNGSTRGNINAQTFSRMPITLPHKEYQKKAVHLLEILEDKIRINNKINDNLVA